MTDYFALLDQPRSPWLDPEELKQAFHARTLQSHPDAQESGRAVSALNPRGSGERHASTENDFVQVNEAYQVLRDPKRRLQHLLALMGEMPSGGSTSVPPEIVEVFPSVASLTNDTEVLLRKLATATTPLSVALLRPKLLELRGAVREMLEQLGNMQASASVELRQIGGVSPEETSTLQRLYLRFSYLTRWMAQLQERDLRLATAL